MAIPIGEEASMGEAQRAKGQPPQKQVNIAGPSGMGAVHTTYARCPCSLSSVPVWTQPPYLQATLRGLFQGQLVFQEGLTITLPACPGARPASLGERRGY